MVVFEFSFSFSPRKTVEKLRFKDSASVRINSQKIENDGSSPMRKQSIEFQSISDDSHSEMPDDTPNDLAQAAQEC